jgi:trigger factor
MSNIKELTIKVEGIEWENALDKAFERINKDAKIDGFRPGKASKEVFLKKYGKESLFMEAADICINEAYVKTLEENKDLEVVAQPELNLKNVDEKGVEFTIALTLKPELKLGKYKGLNVKKDKVEVSHDEIHHTMYEMQLRYAEMVNKEGPVAMGDTVILDFEGFKDGVAFSGGKGENQSLKIGSNTFIPGFEEQLVGMSKGEEKEISVKFPDEYHSEDLKGQSAIFKVKINEVKHEMVPELDADFFQDLGLEGVNDESKLHEYVEETIKARKEVDVENKYLDDLLEAAAKNATVEIPASMINEEIDRMINQYAENLKMQGLSLEQFYQFTNSNEDALKEQMMPEANKRVLYRLLLEAIAKKEEIEVTDEQSEAEAQVLADKYKMDKDEFLKLFGGLAMVKYDLKMRLAIDALKQ